VTPRWARRGRLQRSVHRRAPVPADTASATRARRRYRSTASTRAHLVGIGAAGLGRALDRAASTPASASCSGGDQAEPIDPAPAGEAGCSSRPRS
jgi:hypothetical protein